MNISAYGKKLLQDYKEAIKAVENTGACVPYDHPVRTERSANLREAENYLEKYIADLEARA